MKKREKREKGEKWEIAGPGYLPFEKARKFKTEKGRKRQKGFRLSIEVRFFAFFFCFKHENEKKELKNVKSSTARIIFPSRSSIFPVRSVPKKLRRDLTNLFPSIFSTSICLSSTQKNQTSCSPPTRFTDHSAATPCDFLQFLQILRV